MSPVKMFPSLSTLSLAKSLPVLGEQIKHVNSTNTFEDNMTFNNIRWLFGKQRQDYNIGLR